MSLKWKRCCSWPSCPSTISHAEGIFNYYYYSPSSLLVVHLFLRVEKQHALRNPVTHTLSGHLIPSRYFSLLSCSSLSWISCFYPSLLPALPTTSLTVELSPLLSFPHPCPHSLNPHQNMSFGASLEACIAYTCSLICRFLRAWDQR